MERCFRLFIHYVSKTYPGDVFYCNLYSVLDIFLMFYHYVIIYADDLLLYVCRINMQKQFHFSK
jgi:hypothetical protein